MKICNKDGCGVCIDCNRIPEKEQGDICRYVAEELLDNYPDIIEDLVNVLYVGKHGYYDNSDAKNKIIDEIKEDYGLSSKYLPKW